MIYIIRSVSGFHYDVDVDIAESQEVLLSSRGCLRGEGLERCADIGTRGEALLRTPDSFCDVGAFRTARKHQEAFIMGTSRRV